MTASYCDDNLPPDVTSRVHAQKVRSVIRHALGNTILDAGCGDGRVSVALAGRGFTVIGCDRSPHQARSSKSRGKKAAADIETCAASLTHLPFVTSAFNTVCCLDVLEHVPEISKAIEELQRVVRVGGMIIVAVPAMAHYLIYDKILLKSPISRFLLRRLRYLDYIEDGHFHVHTMTPGMARSRLEATGLRVDSFLNLSFASTYLETIRNVLLVLRHQSSRSFDRLIALDLRIAKSLPLVLGSSWLIILRKEDRPKKELVPSSWPLRIGSVTPSGGR